MLKNVVKRAVVAGLSLSLLAGANFTQAESENPSLEEKLEYFNEQYENTQDFDKSLEKLVEKYPSVKIKQKNHNQIKKNESNKNSGIGTKSVNPTYLSFNDSIIYDDDADQYVYLGGWKWSSITGDEPWDHIGVGTNDTYNMPIDAGSVTLRGYDKFGTQRAYYSTSNGSKSGYVQLSTPLDEEGVGFWINEKYVTNGTISAHLGDASTNYNDRVQLEYRHSWTNTDITGVGISAQAYGGGFQVSWSNSVTVDGPFYSAGAYLK